MAVGRNERGAGGLKILVMVALLLYGIFAAIKAVGVRAEDKGLEDETLQLMRFAGVNRHDDKTIHFLIMKEVKENEIPLKEEQVIVQDQGDSWMVKYSYDRDVDLWVWHWKYKVDFNQTMNKG